MNKKKIFLTSFFIFILLLKTHEKINKVSIFIKPKLFRSMVILRAPYRYKLARLQLTTNRYNIWIFISFKSNLHLNKTQLYKNKNTIQKLTSNLETTFLHQNKTICSFIFKNPENFKLNNFNVNFVGNFF